MLTTEAIHSPRSWLLGWVPSVSQLGAFCTSVPAGLAEAVELALRTAPPRSTAQRRERRRRRTNEAMPRSPGSEPNSDDCCGKQFRGSARLCKYVSAIAALRVCDVAGQHAGPAPRTVVPLAAHRLLGQPLPVPVFELHSGQRRPERAELDVHLGGAARTGGDVPGDRELLRRPPLDHLTPRAAATVGVRLVHLPAEPPLEHHRRDLAGPEGVGGQRPPLAEPAGGSR